MIKRFAVTFACVALVASFSPAHATTPTPYLVGAASKDISPIGFGTIHTGGYGLGDGTSPVSQAIGAGRNAAFGSDHIGARAVVVDDGTNAVALVTVETQGMFPAYQNNPGDGLADIEDQVASDIPRLAGHIVISNDHTHGGPDAIGAWGFIPSAYLDLIASQTKKAIEAAYNARVPASIVAGSDDASDLMYNMTCTEALNQHRTDNYPNNVCTPLEDQKDGLLRAFQAKDATGNVITTVVAYGAHATLGGGNGVHGDWPQFLSDALTAAFPGSTGIAFEGTNGRTQPCRPACSFTDPTTPGYNLSGSKAAYTTMLMHHVDKALADAPDVSGPVAAAKTFIRHEIENPGLFALTQHGELIGAPIQRSLQAPWTEGNTVRTIVSAVRIGDLLINGAPGEPYPNIAAGVVEATNVTRQRHWTLALADDQLGYLISPVEAYPSILAQAYVNDNSLFNVSPTIGDHVMCTQIRLANAVGFTYTRLGGVDPRCNVWDAADTAEAAAGLI